MRKLSRLAVVETFLATICLVAISIYYTNYWFLTTWSLIGGLLMLRTRRSVIRGIWLFNPSYELYTSLISTLADFLRKLPEGLTDPGIPKLIGQSFYNPFAMANMLFAASLLAVGAIIGFSMLALATLLLVGSATACRVAATVWTVCGHPFTSIRSLPDNWRRVAVHTNLGDLFELVPVHARFLQLSGRGGALDHGPLARIWDVRPATLRAELQRPARLIGCLIGAMLLIGVGFLTIQPTAPRPSDSVPQSHITSPLRWFPRSMPFWNPTGRPATARLRALRQQLAIRRSTSSSSQESTQPGDNRSVPNLFLTTLPSSSQMTGARPNKYLEENLGLMTEPRLDRPWDALGALSLGYDKAHDPSTFLVLYWDELSQAIKFARTFLGF